MQYEIIFPFKENKNVINISFLAISFPISNHRITTKISFARKQLITGNHLPIDAPSKIPVEQNV